MSIAKSEKWGGIFFKVLVVLLAAIFTGLGIGGGVSQALAWSPEKRPSAVAVAVVWADWSRSVYTREHVPYFALHPPVYYTGPVGRPYGWGPFAYPAWVETPLVEPPRPMVIQNPYVVGFGRRWERKPIGVGETGIEKPSASSGRTSQPIRIANPYMDQPHGAAALPPSSTGASSTGPAPARLAGDLRVSLPAISSTSAVQPQRIRNPYLSEKE